MSESVLIVDDVHEMLVEGLEEHGFKVYYEPEIAAEDVLERINLIQSSGLVVRSKMSFSGEFFQAVNTLKWIARAGVGMDNIDALAAKRKGIALIHADGANARSVAEHVLGMILGYLHKIYLGNTHVKNGRWDREQHRGVELSARTVGIIGLGNTGTSLATLLQGFGLTMLGYDKYKSGFAKGHLYEVDSIEELYNKADIISYHVPLNQETFGMISEQALKQMKRKPVLVNASRGGIMDVFALKTALQEERISGLILDVWPVEPPVTADESLLAIFEEFCRTDRVIFSPHVAGWSVESYEHISKRLLDNILNFSNPR
jgi:D-3-phosphoglycerate dehydrogenase